MRLGVDVQTLQTAEATRGIGRVVRTLVELLVRNTDHEMLLLGRDQDPRGVEDLLGGRIRYQPIHCPDGSDAAMAVVGMPVADFLRSTPGAADLDLYHVTSPMMPDILLPLAGAGPRMVAKLHDAIPALWQARRQPLMDRRAMDALEVRGRVLSTYDRLLCISECTARDFSVFYDLDPSKMTVTFNPVQPFVPLDPAECQRLTESVGVRGGHVLCISGYNPRKNLRGTLAAYACLPLFERQRHPLVLVCKLQPVEREELESCAEELGIRPHFIATGYVVDDVLRALLQSAAVLFFPSEYEGFGLPVAEALLAGVPVVTRQNSSLPEVTGPGGILTGPGDAESAEALLRLLTHSDLRETLAREGRSHAAAFLPEKYFERVQDAYNCTLAKPIGTDRPSEKAIQPDGKLSDGVQAPGDRCDQRRSLGLPTSAWIVVAGGGARAANRTEVLADMLSRIKAHQSSVVLVLMGECEKEEVRRLVSWASWRCLRHAIIITGPLGTAELDQWLAAADVVITPVDGDGEFQSRALNHGAGPLLIRQNISGYQQLLSEDIAWPVPADDSEAAFLAGAVEMLVKHPAVAEAMVQGARTLVASAEEVQAR
jgi:glycosyltransferase involved in cell wall biosynthesis